MTAYENLKVLALDVDGVLTDGSLYIGPQGEVFKRFHAKDGLGISLAQRAGLTVVFVTGRQSEILRTRAKELRITLVKEGVQDKGEALRQLAAELKVPLSAIGFVGDDLIDLPAFRVAGFTFAPMDAAPEVKVVAGYVAQAKGGRGAVREILELILKDQGLWTELVQSYGTKGQGDRQ